MGRIAASLVARVKNGGVAPGRYRDGANGLILNVSKGGASWLVRYQLHGKRRDLGLGRLETIGLSKARELAAAHQRSIRGDGVDPLAERKAERDKAKASTSFDEVARAYVEAHEPSWKNAKHRQQWRNTLATYVSPKIGTVPVGDLSTEDVVALLKPIWHEKPETASRVRGRVEMILDYAAARGMRTGENPARWKGAIKTAFPSRFRVRPVRHRKAVPVNDLPGVYKRLTEASGIGALATRFCILTASRPGETAGATLGEIDRATKTWTVDPARHKSGKPHRVPLSDEALRVLDFVDEMREEGDQRLFPGATEASPLSLAAMQKALRAAGADAKATTHGTARSGFDDWALERTPFPRRLVDRALGHGPKTATVQAYRRSDLYEQRKPLMEQWGRFLAPTKRTRLPK